MSLSIRQHVSLQPYNSLALPAYAEYFCSLDGEEDLLAALEYARVNQLDVTALGGGSNLVLVGDIAGLVIHLNTKGYSHCSRR